MKIFVHNFGIISLILRALEIYYFGPPKMFLAILVSQLFIHYN